MNQRWLYLPLCAAMGSNLAQAAAITFSAAGGNAAAIQATVDNYRTALGTINPNVVGSFGTGRREINWDGVPDLLSAPNLLPANFFNSNSPRGAVFSTAGTGFEVSATAASGVPVRFGNINAAYSSTFQTFSPERLFTSLGSNVYDVTFFVPGTNTAAFTTGFGAVFSDVDVANTTSIQFFDTSNNSLGTFFAPAANLGLSFIGVRFNNGEPVGRVRITQGNAVLGPADLAGTDVVVADDFIFAEPNAVVPEPSTLLISALGVLLLALTPRRRNSS